MSSSSFSSPVTLVTAFYIVKDKDQGSLVPLDGFKGIHWRIDHFRSLAKLGIPLCVFGDATTAPYISDFLSGGDYPHVKLVEGVRYEDLTVYGLCCDPGNGDGVGEGKKKKEYELPRHRDVKKDTREYMTLMNCKIEFVQRAMDLDPFHTNLFAWIDFSIAYIFKTPSETLEALRTMIVDRRFQREVMATPGYWGVRQNSDILNQIHWRFAGSIFIGTRALLSQLYAVYLKALPTFLSKYGTIVWEVNFWKWLEETDQFQFGWYKIDNDDYDNMFRLPDACFLPSTSSSSTFSSMDG